MPCFLGASNFPSPASPRKPFPTAVAHSCLLPEGHPKAKLERLNTLIAHQKSWAHILTCRHTQWTGRADGGERCQVQEGSGRTHPAAGEPCLRGVLVEEDGKDSRVFLPWEALSQSNQRRGTTSRMNGFPVPKGMCVCAKSRVQQREYQHENT